MRTSLFRRGGTARESVKLLRRWQVRTDLVLSRSHPGNLRRLLMGETEIHREDDVPHYLEAVRSIFAVI